MPKLIYGADLSAEKVMHKKFATLFFILSFLASGLMPLEPVLAQASIFDSMQESASDFSVHDGLSAIFENNVSLSQLDQDDSENIPEEDGDYPVAGRPDLRVRVSVFKPMEAKKQNSSLICGLDPNALSLVGATGWHLPSSWAFTLNLSSVPSSVGAQNLASIASNSFGVWTGVLGNQVNLIQTSDTTTKTRRSYDGKHIIAWGVTSGRALAVTYIWYSPSTGTVSEVDTIMNKNVPWTWSGLGVCSFNSYDAQDILTHELGHWFGLKDEYTTAYQDHTMFGYGSKGETKKDTLTTGDTMGVQNIYTNL